MPEPNAPQLGPRHVDGSAVGSAPPDAPTERTATNSLDWLDRLLELQKSQWAAGHRTPVEGYFGQEPLLRLDRGAQIALIEQERQLRLAGGEDSAFEEYLARFPKLEAELRDLFHRPATEPTLAYGGPPGQPPAAQQQNTLAKDVKQEDTRPDSKFGSRPGRRSGSALSVRLLAAAAQAGYEIQEEVGRGGMGVVYKARHKSLKRNVALKTLVNSIHGDEEMLARFRKEAMAIAKLQHPNIVAVYDVGELEESPYLALEFVDAGSLADLLMKGKQAPLQAALLVEPLARAAHLAHQQGIIHRDLKPANILLAKDGTPKISDFGLAKQMDDATGWTKTGDVMGTPCYMAPEQAEGRIKHINATTDVYALGAILYELVTGQPPFRGATSLETLEQVRTREPAPVRKWAPGAPKDLETIILKCLEKDQALRYPSANALADDLRRFIEDEPIVARRSGQINRLARWWRKNHLVATLLLAIAFLSALFVQQLLAMKRDGAFAEETKPGLGVAPSSAAAVPQPSVAASPGTPPAEAPSPTASAPASKSTASAVAKVENTKPAPAPAPQRPATAEERLKLAQSATVVGEALEHYEAAWKLAKTGASPRKKVELYGKLLAPALKLAEPLQPGGDPETLARAARLYAEKGRLFRDLPYENWGLDQSVHQAGAEAFAAALRLHPKGPPGAADRARAEYHTGRGIAMTRIEGQKPTAIEKELLADAEAAITAAPDYAGGWNLKGFVLYHKAFAENAELTYEAAMLRSGVRQIPLGPIEEAVAAYTQAVAKAQSAQPPDDNAAIYLTNRSGALLLQGYMQEDVARRKESLSQAAADAEAATRLAEDYDLGWQALGFAREALAHKALKVNDKSQYAGAQAAFRKQIELRGGLAEAHLNLGRCLAKELLDDGGAAELASAAASALSEAVAREPNLAEAHVWLGRLGARDKDGSGEAAQAEFLKAMREPAAAKNALLQLRSVLAGQPEQYRELLEAALKAPEKERTADHAPLFLLRSQWGLANDKKELAKANPQPLADAKEAQKLAADPLNQGLARYAAAEACNAIVYAAGVPVDRKLARLADFVAEGEAYLKLRPDSPMALPLLRQLCTALEQFAKDPRRPKEERIEFLKKAVGHAERAGELAVGGDRQAWNRRRQDFQRDLQTLEKAK